MGIQANAVSAQSNNTDKNNHILLQEDSAYAEQFEKLDRISGDLEQLIRFMHDEQGRLYRAKKALEELDGRQQQLAPLVSANQNVVDGLFEEQERRARARAWFELAVAYFVGVASSLSAAFLIAPIRNAIVRRADTLANRGRAQQQH